VGTNYSEYHKKIHHCEINILYLLTVPLSLKKNIRDFKRDKIYYASLVIIINKGTFTLPTKTDDILGFTKLAFIVETLKANHNNKRRVIVTCIWFNKSYYPDRCFWILTEFYWLLFIEQ